MSKKAKIAVILVAAIFVFIIGDLIYSNEFLTVNEYNISTDKIDEGFKIALISDLHNKEFGSKNINLINKISEQEPDVIAAAGDMVTSFEENRSVALELLSSLKDIAPTCLCIGNHEQAYYDYDGLIEDIRNCGAILLDNEMVSLRIGNESVTIGGLTNFPYYEKYAPDYDNEESRFLDKFIEQEDNNFSVLLAHQPEFYMWGLKDKKIDLMLCGHTHGGIVRLPFIGGIIAPNQGILINQGILPEYDMGLYSSDTATMLITSGLGNEIPLPRFNNPPEICIINVNS